MVGLDGDYSCQFKFRRRKRAAVGRLHGCQLHPLIDSVGLKIPLIEDDGVLGCPETTTDTALAVVTVEEAELDRLLDISPSFSGCSSE